MNAPQRKDNPMTRRGSYSHWMKELVRWSDTDLVGHVNNLAFVAYCETGRTHFMGHFVLKEAEHRAMFVIGKLTVNFLDELNWPADVDVGTGVLAIGRRSVTTGQGLFEGERCFATAESVMVCFDERTRTSIDIPDWARDYFARHLIPAASATTPP